MKKLLVLMLAISVLGGCSRVTQLSSGQSYLASYNSDALAVNSKKKFPKEFKLDAEIKKAASIEPLLRFPAKIGLAKLERGSLVDLTDDEIAEWQSFAKKHKKLGEFVPVNVLGTASIFRNVYGHYSGTSVEAVRIAAARQHLQAVIIFELNATERENNTVLAVADLTIVGGAFLPTRSLVATSNARALLVDVRNGYPYGSANAEKEVKKYSPSWGSTERMHDTRKAAKAEAWEALVPTNAAIDFRFVRKEKKKIELGGDKKGQFENWP